MLITLMPKINCVLMIIMFRLKTNLVKGTLIIITLVHHRQGNIVIIIGDRAFEEIAQKSLDILKT